MIRNNLLALGLTGASFYGCKKVSEMDDKTLRRLSNCTVPALAGLALGSMAVLGVSTAADRLASRAILSSIGYSSASGMYAYTSIWLGKEAYKNFNK